MGGLDEAVVGEGGWLGLGLVCLGRGQAALMPVLVAVAVMESSLWSARWNTGGWKKVVGSGVGVVVGVKLGGVACR